ncbi:hypothetical protein MGG_16032 [Pyricularia oryzae 70-15]|uniref:Uncharacterized protein n=3 Tax=Pyricularia oryzae TaxID=318829 RepID=G4MNC2_PYRO7|nr:uncharacterized protein MGG_16032 [Pyricularia oryzae 70-15]EHA56245.1 hypothetical protein MGG_16032 [Pyricularia oryzae 70-15]ELQ42316.1 hypothetical protein OOU_Y34scaffold00216g24 [Pyricularia oryzae Y34]
MRGAGMEKWLRTGREILFWVFAPLAKRVAIDAESTISDGPAPLGSLTFLITPAVIASPTSQSLPSPARFTIAV